MPISAACKITSGSAPRQAEIPAAYQSASNRRSRKILTAIEQATPTSAMQPPSAAEMVAPRLKSIPIAYEISLRFPQSMVDLPEAVKRNVMILSFSIDLT